MHVWTYLNDTDIITRMRAAFNGVAEVAMDVGDSAPGHPPLWELWQEYVLEHFRRMRDFTRNWLDTRGNSLLTSWDNYMNPRIAAGTATASEIKAYKAIHAFIGDWDLQKSVQYDEDNFKGPGMKRRSLGKGMFSVHAIHGKA